MYDQHVYVLSADNTLAAALTDAGIANSTFTDSAALGEAMPSQARGIVLVDLSVDGALDFVSSNTGATSAPIVAVCGAGDVAGAVQAMTAGASGIIESSPDADATVARVRDALKAESAQWPARRQAIAVAHRLTGLTPRETEVLGQLALGLSNRETGEVLGISPRTVEVHRGRIMGKMGAGSMTSLVRMIVEAGSGKSLPVLPPVL